MILLLMELRGPIIVDLMVVLVHVCLPAFEEGEDVGVVESPNLRFFFGVCYSDILS